MEKALEIFINKWKSKKYVEGILLSGSYAVGLENEDSDIDIRLIFNSKYKKNIKGLTVINGYTFSYLGRSSEITKKRFSIDFFNYNKFEARIFGIGKILYDKNKSVEELVDNARVYFTTPFLQKKTDRDVINTSMYALYNSKVSLESLSEKSPFFHYHYYNFFRQAIKWYSLFLGYEFFIDSKIEKILTDENYRNIYLWEKFPDQEFADIWLNGIRPDNVNKKSVILIYYYLEEQIVKIDKKQFTISWFES
ncbi:nucleotidyltransferase domain-containing protein [Chryseobacterium tongliaoense]|uniref:nucleotidyltransferase domain-containing protein n=1 Tax=Chryseobacterium tongliaoense TaxID=3240933 RepID=UPI0035121821